jgi:gamma-glutamyltranspeptidase/glutathione hydrolase
MLKKGGNAVDAAVATAFALAVVLPSAGNIGGGGFLVYRPADGAPIAYDFRETAPAAASPAMFAPDGEYDSGLHHRGYNSVGVPGTVAGLYLAWQDHGRLEWAELLQPAIALARDGFVLSEDLAGGLERQLSSFEAFPASLAKFSKNGEPYQAGETFQQPDLADTLGRIAEFGSEDFYRGETAQLIAADMEANGGLITLEDLAGYEARRRTPIHGVFRGYDIFSMPPPSSGGVALVEMLNILSGFELSGPLSESAESIHLVAEAMRRAYADRARYLGDPDFNPDMPLRRLLSEEYAAELRATIRRDAASVSSPDSFSWPPESDETTHFSVVDAERNAVALTYTLEGGYGSRIVVPGAGFLLNNEMGDFNGMPGLTDDSGLIGTSPNLAAPGKRMLSSMTPAIVARDGELVMVTGSPGGRTIINTVLLTILNVVEFRMNTQEAVDAPRFHHQWLPDRIQYESSTLSDQVVRQLEALGHTLATRGQQGAAQVIVHDAESGMLEGAFERRRSTNGAAGY